MKKSFGLLLVILIVAFVNARKYCEEEDYHLCKKETHVMCHYTNERFIVRWKSYWDFSSPDRSHCPNYQKYQLTQDDKNFILKYHNDRRKRVASGNETRGANGPQPAAVNIPDLEWDGELEYLAQNLVYQCNWDPATHVRKYQCSNVERFNVGQNAIITEERGSNNLKIEDHLNSWYNEVDKFDGNNVDEYHWDPSTRHYTQMVWAATTKIGCAYITYINIVKHVWKYTTRFVCNYGPGGHGENRPVYIRKN